MVTSIRAAQTRNRLSTPSTRKGLISSPKSLNVLESTLSLLFSRYRGERHSFFGEKSANLPHLLQSLRMLFYSHYYNYMPSCRALGQVYLYLVLPAL